MSKTARTTQQPPDGTHSVPKRQEPSDQRDAATNSPIDELTASMIRTLEEIQRDPLLHHRLSQRGF